MRPDPMEMLRIMATASPEGQAAILCVLGIPPVRPIQHDLSNYQRYFRLYDLHHDPKLGPEPTRERLVEAATVCRAEGRLLAEALEEAASVVST